MGAVITPRNHLLLAIHGTTAQSQIRMCVDALMCARVCVQCMGVCTCGELPCRPPMTSMGHCKPCFVFGRVQVSSSCVLSFCTPMCLRATCAYRVCTCVCTRVYTGETTADLKLLERGNIVITTPQRWDMLSRRWRQRKAVQNVSLFIIDELHLIGGEQGPVMEVICSRMRYVAAQIDTPIRIVGLGHSMADAKDVGEWLGAPPHALFAFPPGVRPVPLEIHIHGMDVHNFEARMQAMSRPTYAAVLNHASKGRPALVFVPSRKHARLLALDLLTATAADGDPHRFRLADASVSTCMCVCVCLCVSMHKPRGMQVLHAVSATLYL